MARVGASGRLRTGALLALLLLCLVARGLVPAGWMPSFTPKGVSLIPCSGFGAEPSRQPSAEAGHSGEHGAGDGQPGKSKHDTGGELCAFAAAAIDLPAPVEAAALAGLRASAGHFAKPQEASVGGGLAAPPPPSTGPPGTTDLR